MASSESRENVPASLVIDPRKADALYTPFPPFSVWAKSSVDAVRFERYSGELEKLRDESPDRLRRALEIVKRAAALDTGAIEGLYETDRGFTFTIALQAAHWEAAFAEKGPKVRALFESQLNAYDYVLDFVTQQVPIAEAWIRKLQSEVCGSQDTYQVWTEIGPQEQALPKGQYKHLPNHVIRADGEIHPYAPVEMTPAEMFRFCEELRGEAFLAAHPVLQASYTHYALTVIHPFADGNGRVARALASVFTYRSLRVPILILADTRRDYLAALSAADDSNYQSFVDFLSERVLDAIRLATESYRAAESISVEASVSDIRQLYLTKGGYTHAQVDDAGYRYIELFNQELRNQLKAASAEGVFRGNCNVSADSGYEPVRASHRLPISQQGRRLFVGLETDEPAGANLSDSFTLEVPKDCGREDDLLIHNVTTGETFEARITEMVPVPTAALQMRVSIIIERLLAGWLHRLHQMAAAALKTKGYS